PCDGAPYGRQWFPLSSVEPDRIFAGVVGAAPVLDAFIDQELARTGLAPDRVALVGFSQGTMMALHAGPRRGHALAGIVGYSGLLAGPAYLAAEVRSRPPILLVHGDADPVVPVEALHGPSRHWAPPIFRLSGTSAPVSPTASTIRG